MHQGRYGSTWKAWEKIGILATPLVRNTKWQKIASSEEIWEFQAIL